jgi:hypothetical protein
MIAVQKLVELLDLPQDLLPQGSQLAIELLMHNRQVLALRVEGSFVFSCILSQV